MELSLGERKVRIKFNPSNDDIIYKIKAKHAELINLINELDLESCPGELPERIIENKHITDTGLRGDFYIYKGYAIKKIEESSMWAVKAATVKL